MKRIFFFLLVLICSLNMQAQQSDSILVSGEIADVFTGSIIEDGTVTLLASDSSRIDVGEWYYNTDDGVRTACGFFVKVPREGDYIVRLDHPKYHTLFVPIHVKLLRKKSDWIILREKSLMKKLPRTTQLGEAVVKATQIKMVNKGDTLVYNADAFQLSQGSMLDALIEQLPGAKLNEQGVITVNGRRVSSLLVNGRDFFRGDPRVALENLPAYMVHKVKVYEESSLFEKLSGQREIERPLVMDVNLKREYSTGWIANVEVAGGTERKSLARLFGLRFTDLTRLGLFGNANNTNDTRRAGAKGEWTPSYLPQGEQTSQTAGAEYSYESRQKQVKWTSNVQVEHRDNLNVSHQNSESFLASRRAFGLNSHETSQQSTSVSSDHRWEYHPQSGLQHQSSLSFAYDRNSTRQLFRAGEFKANPLEQLSREEVLTSLLNPSDHRLQHLLVHQRRSDAYSRGENWSLSLPYHFFWFPFQGRRVSDAISVDVSATYDKHTSGYHDRYQFSTFQAGAPATDVRNRYFDAPKTHYRWLAKAQYGWDLGHWRPTLSYAYEQEYTSSQENLYRLDRLPAWNLPDMPELGTLPSTLADWQQALDAPNSGHLRLWHRVHRVEPQLEYRLQGQNRWHIKLSFPIRWQLDHLRYQGELRNPLPIVKNSDLADHIDALAPNLHQVQRSKPLLSPTLFAQRQQKVGRDFWVFTLNYHLTPTLPDLINALQLTNDANPLYIRQGNPQLKPSIDHNLSLTIMLFKGGTWKVPINFAFNYHNTHHALGTERNYNPATGSYLVRPVNIEGNWYTNAQLTLNGIFGKSQAFSWSSTSSFLFNHSVDAANVQGVSTNALSTVKTRQLSEHFSLNYALHGWHVGLKTQVNYQQLTGDRVSFIPITAWDYHYGLTARIPLPAKFSINTDFTVFSRRGYADAALNTDNLVWNARLERSILHGHLTFALDGFDLLHSLTNVSRKLNAQGRTETYYNVLPSYFMARAIYKFNVEPKKKK